MKKFLFHIIFCLLAYPVFAQVDKYPSRFTVAADGSEYFKSIQEAIFAVQDLSQEKVTIFIKNGNYREKIIIPSWKTNNVLLGESHDSTIITYDDYAGKHLGQRDEFLKTDSIRTYTSYTVLVQGNDCSIENLTVKNTAGKVGQAVALHVEGDRFIAKNYSLLGKQDNLYAVTENSWQYYSNYFIEGTTGFIFGEATAVFQKCIIKSFTNSFITAASTRPRQKFGFVFFDCRLISDTAVKNVYLGRLRRPYAKTVFFTNRHGCSYSKGWLG